jgi:hypothetical protein
VNEPEEAKNVEMPTSTKSKRFRVGRHSAPFNFSTRYFKIRDAIVLCRLKFQLHGVNVNSENVVCCMQRLRLVPPRRVPNCRKNWGRGREFATVVSYLTKIVSRFLALKDSSFLDLTETAHFIKNTSLRIGVGGREEHRSKNKRFIATKVNVK